MRYTTKPCSTGKARSLFHNVRKVGTILKIEGVRYTTRQKSLSGEGTFKVVHEVVRVTGIQGIATFHGLCWGYSGEGPRGCRDLLMFCGLAQSIAEKMAFGAGRQEAMGVDWSVEFQTNNSVIYSMGTMSGPRSSGVFTHALVETSPVSLLRG